MSSFFHLSDANDQVLARVLSRAKELELEPIQNTLRGVMLGLVFMNPSLRTLASCQSAIAQLGGQSFVLSPGQGSWAWETEEGAVMDGERAEHIAEAIPVLEQYADLFGLRCFARGESLEEDASEPILSAIDAYAKKPWINLESGFDHPCQALADWKTLDDEGIPKKGGKIVLSWAYHPRPLPFAVPAAVMRMAMRRGMDLTVLRPEGFHVPDFFGREMVSMSQSFGGTWRETSDMREATNGAHVIYAKSWMTTVDDGDRRQDEAIRKNLRAGWCVDDSWFENAAEDAIFMHCLPIRRNVVASDSVLDGPRSRVTREAGNRLHVFKSLLLELLDTRMRAS